MTQPDEAVQRRGGTARRGTLRIYLGAAAGVGKTFAMLGEGHRRLSRGADVVVAFVETHGRAAYHRATGRARGGPPGEDQLPRHHVRGDGHGRGAGPPSADRAGRRTGPHQRARLAQRQALAGRRGTAQGRHRRHHDGEHPAPRVAERRGHEDHRRSAAGDRAGRRGAGRRPDRTGRHDARGAAPPDGARQHLSGREDRRRAQQLLPGRQPDRAPRAGAALAGRPGR